MWYKGNLHSHTVNSDGNLTPRESARLYRENGYHFLCFSEHDQFTDYREELNEEEFLILPGLEASALLLDMTGEHTRLLKTHHMLGILGTQEMQANAEDELFTHMETREPDLYFGEWDGAAAAQKLADELRKRGCAVTYNHPVWSRVEPEEFIHTEGLAAVEIFNYNTVNESGTGFDTQSWDAALRKGIGLNGFASDDNHNGGLFDDACGGWIMVHGEELTHDGIISSLLAGDFYSSSGPELYEFGISEGVAFVTCSPVQRINLIAGGYVNAGETKIAAGPETSGENLLTEARFTLRGDETYLRIECIDERGKVAWTNVLT